MSTEENKATARRFLEQGFNRHDLGLMEATTAPNVVNHSLPAGIPPNREGWKMMASMFFAAFPDMQVTIDDLLAEGDSVVTRWTGRGTHQGEMMGIPPTDKPVTLTGITIDRFENGKIAEHWENLDQLGMLQQLGVIPPPQA
jgi:steroid delta-isomerase-like uncharacterized protein